MLCDTLMWDTTFVNASAANERSMEFWFWEANGDSYTYGSDARHEYKYLSRNGFSRSHRVGHLMSGFESQSGV